MERRLIGIILGILSSLLWPQVPSFSSALIILAVGVGFSKRQPLLSSVLLGISYSAVLINWQFNDLQYLKLQNSSISGTIISLPEQRKYSNRFFFKLSKVHFLNNTRNSDGLLLVYWSGQHQLQQGQQLKLTVDVRPIHGLANQGGFNYQKWLISKGVIGTAKATAGEITNAQPALRSQIAQQLSDAVASLTNGRYIRALALADKTGFNASDWQLLANTGTSHLFAISGLHLAIVFALTFAIVKLMLVVIVGQGKSGIERRLSLITTCCALLVAVGYSYLADFSLPTVRALVMLTVMAIATSSEQRLSLTQLVIYTLFAVMVWRPLSVLSLSFWLSFSAVSSLILLAFLSQRQVKHLSNRENSRADNIRGNLINLLRIQCWLFATMAGLQLLFFSGVSLVAPLANMIAVPAISLVILPLILIALLSLVLLPQFGIANVLFTVADWLISAVFKYLDILSSWQQSWLASNAIDYWLVVIALGIVIVSLTLINMVWRRTLVVVIMIGLMILAPLIVRTDKPDWLVYFVDVGQGNAAVIIKNDRAIVFDTGKSSNKSLSELVILPLLQYQGVTTLDYLILSHQDNDHAGGWRELMAYYPSAQLVSNWPDKPRYRPIIDCAKIQAHPILWQGLTLSFFMAPASLVTNENDRSCVTQVDDGNHRVLFTGDISAKIEDYMVNNLDQSWQSDVVTVPHHGSKTSSSTAFIDFMAPTLAVLSAGRFNRWGFPAASVVSHYRAANVTLASTADNGQITIEFHQKEPFNIRYYRNSMLTFWYNRYRSY